MESRARFLWFTCTSMLVRSPVVGAFLSSVMSGLFASPAVSYLSSSIGWSAPFANIFPSLPSFPSGTPLSFTS